MKITPDLFTQATPYARPAREATQARLAFEAMLSAGAARQTVVTRTMEPVPGATPARAAPPPVAKEDGQAPLARPGRVLDIRV